MWWFWKDSKEWLQPLMFYQMRPWAFLKGKRENTTENTCDMALTWGGLRQNPPKHHTLSTCALCTVPLGVHFLWKPQDKCKWGRVHLPLNIGKSLPQMMNKLCHKLNMCRPGGENSKRREKKIIAGWVKMLKIEAARGSTTQFQFHLITSTASDGF